MLPETVPQDHLQITSVYVVFRLDNIAQEENETFTLSFSGGNFESNPTLRNTLSGTIVDANGNKKQL